MKIDKTFKLQFQNDDFGYLDAFGLESEHIFAPYKDIELPDVPSDITLVVGESGSGKTQLCNILKEKWNFTTMFYPNDDDICCEFIGKDKASIDKCIYYLNYVGLSDARLYYTAFKYLSDSQKFRATVANTLMKNSGGKILIDEFLSTLDRDTAKSIAYLIQKIARKTNTKLLLATAHNDLNEYISPDTLIEGQAFPERFSVYNKPFNEFSAKTIDYTIQQCTKEDYANSRLGELHYKGKYVGGAKEFFVAKLNNKDIGFIVGVVTGKDTTKRRIARVVVHPSYRGIGVGTKLVKALLDYYKDNNIKHISAVSALGMFNPFFDKAGMVRLKDYVIKPNMKMLNSLQLFGFNKDKWFSRSYCENVCENVDYRNFLSKYAKNAKRAINPGGSKPSINKIKQMLLAESLHSGRFLWTLRPKTLARYESNF